MTSGPEDRVCVGAIAGAFGVRGEARIKPFTDDPEAVAAYGPLSSEDGARQFEVKLTRPVKGGWAARLSGVRTREEAEALKGVRLYAPRAALPEPEEDEFYHADLIGLDAVGLDGALLGRVRSVQNYGAGDFVEVTRPRGQPLLIPFTREAVPRVEISLGRIVVDPPEEIEARDDPGASA